MGIFSETAEEMRDELVDKYEAEIARLKRNHRVLLERYESSNNEEVIAGFLNDIEVRDEKIRSLESHINYLIDSHAELHKRVRNQKNEISRLETILKGCGRDSN